MISIPYFEWNQVKLPTMCMCVFVCVCGKHWAICVCMHAFIPECIHIYTGFQQDQISPQQAPSMPFSCLTRLGLDMFRS